MVYLRYGMIFLFLTVGAVLAIFPSGFLGSREALKGAAEAFRLEMQLELKQLEFNQEMIRRDQQEEHRQKEHEREMERRSLPPIS
jgi:hypothetical protein